MTTNQLKKSVIDNYGKLAKANKSGLFSKLFGCCDNGALAQQIGEQIGYSEQEMEAVPEGANLGIGCGNPSALAGILPGETVVDLGSGAGFDAFLVAPLVGKQGRVIGIELSDQMISLARKNARKTKHQNVEFTKGDIEALPLDAAMADHIISNCVINLSTEKATVFREAYRVLKPGGRLAISDIVLERELPEFVKSSLAGHLACVSGAEPLEDYLGYIRAAGFVDIRIEERKAFPLELMLSDPQVKTLARQMNFDLESAEARDIAGRVSSITLTARK